MHLCFLHRVTIMIAVESGYTQLTYRHERDIVVACCSLLLIPFLTFPTVFLNTNPSEQRIQIQISVISAFLLSFWLSVLLCLFWFVFFFCFVFVFVLLLFLFIYLCILIYLFIYFFVFVAVSFWIAND
jgi:hypothetical protein